MKARRIKLTAATLSAFLGLGGLGLSQDTGGDKARLTSRNAVVKAHKGYEKGHKGGKKGRKGGKKGHKGGKKSKKGSASTTPPPK